MRSIGRVRAGGLEGMANEWQETRSVGQRQGIDNEEEREEGTECFA